MTIPYGDERKIMDNKVLDKKDLDYYSKKLVDIYLYAAPETQLSLIAGWWHDVCLWLKPYILDSEVADA